MGNEFIGIVHPSKVYNIMVVGAPILYIGPSPSHVTDIALETPGTFTFSAHGDVASVVDGIVRVETQTRASGDEVREAIVTFAKQELLPQFVALLESTDLSTAIRPESVSGEVSAL
jgi:hypothetical protein